MNRHLTIRPSLSQPIAEVITQVRQAITQAQAAVFVDCNEVVGNSDHFFGLCEEINDVLEEHPDWEFDRIEDRVVVILNSHAPLAKSFSDYDQAWKNELAVGISQAIGQRAILVFDPREIRII